MLRTRLWRNAQFQLCACAYVAPHRQFSSNQYGTFRHAAQSVVALNTVGRENRFIDTFSVVPHP
jgi:hypothetical protein